MSELAKFVKEHNEIIDSNNKAYQVAVHTFQVQKLHERDVLNKPHKDALKKIEKNYVPIVFQKALDDNNVPYDTWGDRMEQTSVKINEVGITLYWDINGDYAPYHYTMTWKDLENGNHS